MKLYGSLSRLVSILFRKDSQDITVQPNQTTTYTAARATQLPAGDTDHILVSRTSTDTLTNKTLTAPAISSPTGLVKADVGLANVDNTSDATKDAATATLTNKTLTSPVINSPTGIVKGDVGLGNVDNTSNATERAATATLTNKSIDADTNTITNIENADIKSGAAIDATKIADGSVTSAEFQFINTLSSNAQTQLNGKQATSEKGAANGYASLDGGGKVPVAQLPSSVMTYEGTWAASTNTPTLANGTGDAGMVYLASDAGSVNFGAGAISFAAGDWAVYSGTIWQKSINSNAVVSVNGATGVVTVNAINELTGDVTATAASGSQSKATTIAAGAVDNGKIATNAAIAVSKLAAGTNTYQLTTVAGVPTWTAPAAATVTVFAADWVTADTATKAVTHSLGTKNIQVQIYDKTDDSTIMIDSIVRTSTSVVTLSASEAPGAAGWKVLIIAQ